MTSPSEKYLINRLGVAGDCQKISSLDNPTEQGLKQRFKEYLGFYPIEQGLKQRFKCLLRMVNIVKYMIQ
jgi:hypothetical protein